MSTPKQFTKSQIQKQINTLSRLSKRNNVKRRTVFTNENIQRQINTLRQLSRRNKPITTNNGPISENVLARKINNQKKVNKRETVNKSETVKKSILKFKSQTRERQLKKARKFFVEELEPLNENRNLYEPNNNAEFRLQENITRLNLKFIDIIARKIKMHGLTPPVIEELKEMYKSELSKYRKRQYNLNFDPDVYYKLAKQLLLDKDIDGAEDAIRTAIKINPNNKFYYYQLSLILYDKNDYDGSEEAIKQALQLNPSDPYYFRLSLILYQKDDYDGSEEAIKQAIKLNPNNKFYNDFLSIVLEEKHSKKK